MDLKADLIHEQTTAWAAVLHESIYVDSDIHLYVQKIHGDSFDFVPIFSISSMFSYSQ